MKTQVYRIRLTAKTHKLLKVAATIEDMTISKWLEKAIKYTVSETMNQDRLAAIDSLLKATEKK